MNKIEPETPNNKIQVAFSILAFLAFLKGMLVTSKEVPVQRNALIDLYILFSNLSPVRHEGLFKFNTQHRMVYCQTSHNPLFTDQKTLNLCH